MKRRLPLASGVAALALGLGLTSYVLGEGWRGGRGNVFIAGIAAMMVGAFVTTLALPAKKGEGVG